MDGYDREFLDRSSVPNDPAFRTVVLNYVQSLRLHTFMFVKAAEVSTTRYVARSIKILFSINYELKSSLRLSKSKSVSLSLSYLAKPRKMNLEKSQTTDHPLDDVGTKVAFLQRNREKNSAVEESFSRFSAKLFILRRIENDVDSTFDVQHSSPNLDFTSVESQLMAR